MTDRVFILVDEPELAPGSPVQWLLYRGDALLAADQTALSDLVVELDQHGSDYQLAVIVAAELSLLASVEIPSSNASQIEKALPFTVEELLAEDVENVHIAIGPLADDESNRVHTAILSHSLLVNWLDQLYSAGLSPEKLYIDALCVPWSINTVSLLIDQQRILVRSNEYSGMAMQFADYPLLLKSILSELRSDSDNLVPLIKIFTTEEPHPQINELLDFCQQQLADHEVQQLAYESSTFEVLAAEGDRYIEEGGGLNILQGGYAVKQAGDSSWMQWGMAASVAAIGVLVYSLFSYAGGWYFESKADGLDGEAIALYKELFPNERRVVSPKKQMQNHIALKGGGGGAGSHFLQLLNDTASQFASEDDSNKLLIEQLRFESDNGELLVQIQGPSIESLDKLKQQLEQSGLSADINSASEQDDYVVARLEVRRI